MAETLYRYGIKITPKGDHSLQFRRPKMEIGSIETDWSPAPEDPDDETMELISILQTDFSVVQGQIQAKVWETDIEKATDGVYESINEIYSYIDETANGITAEVGDLSYTVNNNYEYLTAQISDLIITDTEISTQVADIQQSIIGIAGGANLLWGTENLQMTAPWRTASSESSGIVSWNVFADSGLPAGSSYALVQAKNASSASGGYYASFHWCKDDDIFWENRDGYNSTKLEEGHTYTFSFYITYGKADTVRIFFNYMVYGQTVLDSSLNTTGYGDIQTDGSANDWTRIWVTFRIDNLDKLRIGAAYGPQSLSMNDILNVQMYFCGFMLNEGAYVADWDNGQSNLSLINEAFSRIDQLSDSITATVENIRTDFDGQITALYAQFEILSDSITATVADLSSDVYAQLQVMDNSITTTVADLKKDVSSQIEQLAGSISLTVTNKASGTASIVMTANGTVISDESILPNGTRSAFANDSSSIVISAGTITFNSNTFVVNSSYFSVTANGTITATAGKIAGWVIKSNALYSGTTSLTDTTSGTYLGLNGIRNNSGIGTALTDGKITFYDSDGTARGSLYAYKNNGGWGIYLGKADTRLFLMGDLWIDNGSHSLIATYTGHVKLTGASGNNLYITFSNGIVTSVSGSSKDYD